MGRSNRGYGYRHWYASDRFLYSIIECVQPHLLSGHASEVRRGDERRGR